MYQKNTLGLGDAGGRRDKVASTYNQSQPHGKEYKYLDMNSPLKIQLQTLLAHGQTYNKPTNVETQSGKSDMKLAGNVCKMHFVKAKMCSPPNTKLNFPRQSEAAL